MLLETSLRRVCLKLISQFRPAEHQLVPLKDLSQQRLQRDRSGFSPMGTAAPGLDQGLPIAAKAAVATRPSIFPNDRQMCFHS